MYFQVYTSTCGEDAKSYVAPDNQLWDNQKMIFEANTIKEISKHFDRRVDFKWRQNKLFLVDLEKGCLEIHCKSNQKGLKIFPPQFKGDKIIYPIPRGKKLEKLRRVTDQAVKYRDLGKFVKYSDSEEFF